MSAEKDLSEDFYDAEMWGYMTVNGGKSNDGGGVPYSLKDGSIKFHNANQCYLLEEDLSNGDISFMIKTTKNWQIWLRASTKDNSKTNCYKLYFLDEVLHIRTSESSSDLAYVSAKDCNYRTTEWNKMKISFATDESKNCSIKITVNDTVAPLTVEDREDCTEKDGCLVYTEKEDFILGNYFAVKVWYGDCILQLKPINGKSTLEPLKIACIGDSITYGANADNSYTDSYPAVLQTLYGKEADVINLGNSGKTIRDSADDPYRKTTEYNAISLYKPDITIIMLGTNDSKTYQVPTKSELINAYRKLIEDLLKINPVMDIYMATCPYAYTSNYQISNKNIEKIVIPAIREVAESYSLEVIEMHEYTKNMKGCYADGIHPTSKGYAYLAQRFYWDLEGITPDESYIASFKD